MWLCFIDEYAMFDVWVWLYVNGMYSYAVLVGFEDESRKIVVLFLQNLGSVIAVSLSEDGTR